MNMEWLRSYLLGLTAAALICTAALELTPTGAVKSVLRSLCGLVMAAALIAPLLRLDYSAYALDLGRYRREAGALTASAEEERRQADRRVISQELETYIWDKAAAVGAELEHVELRLRWASEGYWYPESVILQGVYSKRLSDVMEAELGIARESQIWRTNEIARSDELDEGTAAP